MKRNLLWAIPTALLFTACGGGEESTDGDETSESEPVEATIEYGPFLSTEEVSESERLATLEEFNAVEDKSTVIRYVSSEYNSPFPTELLDAYNLQVLSLNSMKGELPEEMGTFQNMTTLVIQGEITKLPESIGELEHLKVVSLSGCKDLDIEQAIGVLANCPIENLDLTYTGITELPANIGDLKSLKHIRLGNNPLTTLPESFYTLSNLKSLRLGNNEGMDYEGVLASAKDLPALENLWLQYCGFDRLPDVLGEYPSLTKVNWREEWENLDSDGIIALTEKESKRFENFEVSWNSMSGMYYDIY